MSDTREVEVPPRPRAAQVMEVPILPGLYVRQALDIQWSDLAVSYARTLLPLAQDHAAAVADLEEFWGVEGESEGVCALSVRSFFHALLTYLDLPAGSEVIMSAVTIKDMPRIVRHHGLVPVPVDIDLATLAPRLDLLEAAVSSKSRLLVVAPLFGSRTDVAPYAAFARAHGLLFMEDCAQRFEGEESYRGHPDADLSVFSFGSIKTCSALGGAMATVRDRDLADGVRGVLAGYPIRPHKMFLKKLMTYSVLVFISHRAFNYWAADRLLTLMGRDLDETITTNVRGFPGDAFFALIEHQLDAPSCLLLADKLRSFNPDYIPKRTYMGKLAESLVPEGVFLPGHLADRHYWQFPVMAEDPMPVVGKLKAAGFDATQGASQLYCVPVPEEWTGGVGEDDPRADVLEPLAGQAYLRHVVYLPVYGEMPEEGVRRLFRTLKQVAPLSSSFSPRTTPPLLRSNL